MVEVGGSNPPGPTKFLSLRFYWILFFRNRAFWRVLVRGHYRGKVATKAQGANLMPISPGLLPSRI